MIFAINVGLIVWSFICLVSAAVHLHRRKPRPIIATTTAVLSVFFFMLCITSWNTLIPVWVWWIILGGVSALVGYANYHLVIASHC